MGKRSIGSEIFRSLRDRRHHRRHPVPSIPAQVPTNVLLAPTQQMAYDTHFEGISEDASIT